jgi:two-component system, chemotaxis family, sensor kinase CheA
MDSFEDELLNNLRSTFRAEAAEHLQTLNQALLQLERIASDDPEAAQRRHDLIQNAFRAAHSLKGAARAVSFTDVETLAHGLESILHAARDGKLSLTVATCDVLYEVLDVLQQAVSGQAILLDSVQHKLATIGGSSENGSSAAKSIEVVTPAAEGAVRENRATETVSPAAPDEETIRVALSKLDDLMAQVGELLVSKISAEQHMSDVQDVRGQLARWPKTWREIQMLLPRLTGDSGPKLTDLLTRHNESQQALLRGVNTLHQGIHRDTLRLAMVTAGLQDSVRKVRMVPFQSLVLGLERAVRDAARSEDKQVSLHIDGSQVELDKKVLEMLKDPLLHLLRNAIGHGLESPDRRAELGKPAEGQIVLSVQQRGGEVRVAVSDDGRGFDLDGLKRASARSGGPILDENASTDAIIALAFRSGVSTAEKVTSLSGRGVGLDVVRRCLEAVQGRVVVESIPGKGTTIQLLVPTSVAMTRALLVRIGSEHYMLPLLSVEKIVKVEAESIFTVEGRPVVTLDNRPIPVVSLAAVLGRTQTSQPEKLNAAVIAVAEQRVALLVDELLTEQEVAVKPLGRLLIRVRNVSGAALLGNGKPVVVLNAADLVKSARHASAAILPSTKETGAEVKPVTRILVVDDSITTRTLEKNILETAGYEVVTATDGLGALKQLGEQHIELVVSDIQMPHMDGIALTQQLRQSQDYRSLPIILVTSLESREDRERGLVAGADAYIVKRGFDQAELLSAIESLL